MDMTSAAESRWYDNPRLGSSPNAGTSHQGGGGGGGGTSNGGNGLVDASDMGAFYSLENAGHARRYYSTGYGPHGKFFEAFHNFTYFRRKTKEVYRIRYCVEIRTSAQVIWRGIFFRLLIEKIPQSISLHIEPPLAHQQNDLTQFRKKNYILFIHRYDSMDRTQHIYVHAYYCCPTRS